MSHSHLAVRCLIRRLEAQGRTSRRRSAPDWLAEFVDSVVDLFETQVSAARAGYECWPVEQGWSVRVFLGANECVGGPNDGRRRSPGFDLDVLGLAGRFERLERLIWSTRDAAPDVGAEGVQAVAHESSRDTSATGRSAWLIAEGRVSGRRVRLQVCDRPPADCAPGLRLAD